MKIFKYPFAIESKTTVEMPYGHVFLHVGLDPEGVPCVWALVDEHSEKRPVELYVVGTGADVPENAANHLGTFIQTPFVWHIFSR